MPSNEVFTQALDLKLEIARKLTSEADNDLIETDNLFSGCLKFIIFSVQSDHSHISQLFAWAKKTFTRCNSYRLFCSKFYPLTKDMDLTKPMRQQLERICSTKK